MTLSIPADYLSMFLIGLLVGLGWGVAQLIISVFLRIFQSPPPKV